MKTFMIVATLLMNLVAQAEDFPRYTIENKTYPEQKLVIQCLDIDCASLEITYGNSVKTMTMQDLEKMTTAKLDTGYDERKRTGNQIGYVTQEELKGLGKKWQEGHKGKVVRNLLLAPIFV